MHVTEVRGFPSGEPWPRVHPGVLRGVRAAAGLWAYERRAVAAGWHVALGRLYSRGY